MVDRNETQFTASGLMSEQERLALDGFLRRIGLSVVGLVDDTPEAPKMPEMVGDPSEFALEAELLASVTSREDYVGREHAIAYQRLYTPETPLNSATTALNVILNPRTIRPWDDPWLRPRGFHIDPIDLGLVVKDRVSAGLPPLDERWVAGQGVSPGYTPKEKKEQVVQLGSLIDFIAEADRFPVQLSKFQGKYARWLTFFTLHLANQVEQQR